MKSYFILYLFFLFSINLNSQTLIEWGNGTCNLPPSTVQSGVTPNNPNAFGDCQTSCDGSDSRVRGEAVNANDENQGFTFGFTNNTGSPIRIDNLTFGLNRNGQGHEKYMVYYNGNFIVTGNLSNGSTNGIVATINATVPAGSSADFEIRLTSFRGGVPSNCSGNSNGGKTTLLPGTIVSGAVLPVVLADFSAKVHEKNTVRVAWTTTQEINNDYFLVQRSRDGKTWKTISDRIAGNGTTDAVQRYAFLDEQPLPGMNIYQLIQVDYDGSEHQHGPVFTDFRASITESALVVYPNPARAGFQLVSPVQLGSQARYRITNLQGRIVTEQPYRAGRSIATDQLSPGWYQVQLTDGAQHWIGRVFVL